MTLGIVVRSSGSSARDEKQQGLRRGAGTLSTSTQRLRVTKPKLRKVWHTEALLQRWQRSLNLRARRCSGHSWPGSSQSGHPAGVPRTRCCWGST